MLVVTQQRFIIFFKTILPCIAKLFPLIFSFVLFLVSKHLLLLIKNRTFWLLKLMLSFALVCEFHCCLIVAMEIKLEIIVLKTHLFELKKIKISN